MNSDWRADSNHRFLQQSLARENEYRAQVSKKLWSEFTTAAVRFVVEFWGGGTPSAQAPSAIDGHMRNVWSFLLTALKTPDDARAPRTDEETALLSSIATELGRQVSDRPSFWESASKFVGSFSIGWRDFVEGLSPTDIIANEKTLPTFPTDTSDPADWIDTYSVLREPKQWQAFLAERTQPRANADPWQTFERDSRLVGDLRLASSLRFAAQLAHRGGLGLFARWLAAIPLRFLVPTILNEELKSPDDAHALLEAIFSADLDEDTKIEFSIFVLMRVVELFTTIWRNLAHGAEARWALPGQDDAWKKKCTDALTEWKQGELNQQAAKIGKVLAASAAGQKVAVYALRNIFTLTTLDERERDPKVNTRTSIRIAVSKALRQSSTGESVYRRILDGDPRMAAVLAAARLLVEDTALSTERRQLTASDILKTYTKLLSTSDFYWQTPLQDDQQELAFCLAAALAEFPGDAAECRWKSIFSTVFEASEGWKSDGTRYYESIPRVAHVCTVGAMAAEWFHHRARACEAAGIFDAVWAVFHDWLRLVDSPVPGDESVTTPIANLWARLLLVHPQDLLKYATSALENIDRLDWSFLAASNLHGNLERENKQLDVSLQRQLRDRYNLLMPLIRRQHAVEKQTIDYYQKRADILTPDASAG